MLVAALLASAAAWSWWPSPSAGLARLGAVPPPPRAEPEFTPLSVALLTSGLLVASALAGGPRLAAISLLVLQVAGAVALLVRRRRRRVRRDGRRTDVVQAGELVAGLLRVGRVPSAALIEASADAPVLAVAAAELRAGGEASAALRRQSTEVGLEGLGDLADAWEVSVITGASLVEAVDAASSRLAAEADVARVVEAELSAARLAGRIMALLPLAGLALGFGLGGNPVEFLLSSPVGWVCLNVGAAFACGGIVWIDTIAERAGGR